MATNSPPSHNTKPHVFIVESLKIADESKERYDGKYLYDYLKLLGKKPIYYYIRSYREFKEFSDIFRESGYRYLHISCHGNSNEVATTFDDIPYSEFSDMFSKKLEHRRVFISGCELGNMHFAEHLFSKNGGMYSLVAPSERVYFHQMLPFWSTFYYLMDSINEKSMKGSAITPSLQACSNIFGIKMSYIYKYTKKNKIVEKNFEPKSIFSDAEMNKILKSTGEKLIQADHK